MGYSNEHTLNDLLRRVLQNLDMTDQADAIEVKHAYHDIVGDMISKLTLSIDYRNSTLYLKIASPAMKNELSYKKNSLMEKINQQIKHGNVQKIIFL